MSKIEVKLENKVLTIHRESVRKTENDTEKYNLDMLEIEKQYVSKLRVTKAQDKNKILFFQKQRKNCNLLL